jgi:hypothetical protein
MNFFVEVYICGGISLIYQSQLISTKWQALLPITIYTMNILLQRSDIFQGQAGTAWPLKMGLIGYNYQSKLRNIPEERRSHLHRDRSLKSHAVFDLLCTVNQFKCSIRYWTMCFSLSEIFLSLVIFISDLHLEVLNVKQCPKNFPWMQHMLFSGIFFFSGHTLIVLSWDWDLNFTWKCI